MKNDHALLTVLAGSGELDDRPWQPFSGPVMEFLDALSAAIRHMPRSAGEEIKALGFWLRKTHLEELKRTYHQPGRLGLGISFHIAPANVPLLFAYTCAIGLLAGNSCRVRLSERRTKEAETLCHLICSLLEQPQYQPLQKRLCLLSYDHSDACWSEAFSRECDARLIWGGDQTVERIRRIPIKPSASEVVFPDRSSITLFQAEAVLALSESQRLALAEQFYRDTYSMDQNACSCPKSVFWLQNDKDAGRQASALFWETLAVTAKRYDFPEIKASRKYSALWQLAGSADSVRYFRHWGNRLYVIELDRPPAAAEEALMMFGSFLEYFCEKPDDWIGAVTQKTQTLTYFGLSPEALRNTVIHHKLKGVDRIVPVGRSLTMDLTWDGKNLIECLTRSICLVR